MAWTDPHGEERFDFGALEELLQERLHDQGEEGLALVLGVHRRYLARWRQTGLTADRADALATKIGRHPGELWPAWWIEDTIPAESLHRNDVRGARNG